MSGPRPKAHKAAACGKRRYRDAAEAKAALALIRRSEDVRDKTPARAYPCERCKGWHLTSRA